jgi:predicted dehydrogenase
MRLALLGADDTTLALIRAAMRGGQDQVVMIDAVSQRASEAATIAPKAQLITDWEAVFGGDGIDAVIVGADDPTRRIEQLKRIAQIQQNVPILVAHPLSGSMLDCYELEMIRRESGGVLLPCVPARWHPAAAELKTMVDNEADSPIGKIEQIIFERRSANRSRDFVLAQFARDVDLLQYLGGEATKLHAFGPGANQADTSAVRNSDADLRNLAVQMTSNRGIASRWSIAPVEDRPGAVLTLVGASGKAVLAISDDDAPWRLEVRGNSESSHDEFPGWHAPTAALEKLADVLSGEEPSPTWAEAARTVELAETINTSLARGRTIELHREEFTDVATFKGTMASVGCGLLMLGLTLAVAVAIIHALAAQAGWNRLAAALDNWPYILLVTLAVFLLLQLFVFAGKAKPKTGQDE